MTPTPLPPPPSPPATITVEIPPDVLERLAPHTDTWFTQPVATVAAAVIALIAAAIAWFGVRRQVLAQDRRDAKADRINVLSETLDASAELFKAALEARILKGATTVEVPQLGIAMQLACAKLALFDGLEASRIAALEYLKVAVQHPADGDEQLLLDAQQALHAAFAKDASSSI